MGYTYAATVADGSYVGLSASAVIEADLGAFDPGTPYQHYSKRPGNVPEPSTIAIGGLGAVSLWLFHRQKQKRAI